MKEIVPSVWRHAVPRAGALRMRLLLVGALALCLLGLRWIDPAPLELMRLRAFDLGTAFCQPADGFDGVVAVDIDDRSLAVMGQWPWPRDVLARLVDRMVELGAGAVVFTIVFAERDRDQPASDRIFAEALRRVPTVLVQIPWEPEAAPGLPQPVTLQGRFALLGETGAFRMPAQPGVVGNLPDLVDAAAGLGMARVAVDTDGIIRRVTALAQAGGVPLPGLALEALRVVDQRSGFMVEVGPTGLEALRVGPRRLPVDADGWFRPRLCGVDRVPVIPAVDLLREGGDVESMRGRVAVVGVSARGVGRLWRVASSERGVSAAALEAGVIGDLLQGRWLHRPPFATLLEVLALLGGTFCIGGLDGRHARIVLALVLGVAGAGLASLAFWIDGSLFDWTLPILGFILAPLVAGMAERGYERAAQRQRDRFMRQVVDASPDPILTVAADGTILSCNEAAVSMSLCDPDGLIGREAGPLFGLALAEMRALIRRRLDGAPIPPVEVTVDLAGREPIHLELVIGVLDASSVILIGRDITRRKLAQVGLARALATNEALLREIHHRVRNNLQGIWGVIALEKAGVKDAKALERMSAIQDRLLVLGRIHEQLALSGDLARIDVAVQIDQLAQGLIGPRLDDGRITIHTRAEPLHCHIEIAMPLGLIINELVGNCLKFAFPDNRAGMIRVRLERCRGRVVLEVADDGVGLPRGEAAVSDAAGEGMGIGKTLLQALAAQLDATVELAGPPGHVVRVVMPGGLFD
ncbi:hypothetical protein N825_17800 [Skermanella stibiiresistens SB22]|uniref:Histidine kinase domain-containing protein n=1 Tax=Skermanella stibiiresistens SB22 TaxID=1385369 RepID=W9GU84_9PROT|nr:CHASE2 domain-containing protein [Skermanella stibiiresistens]EWY37465.1 hypothetical protein N825_17800 [Skermanella stibiiresistens SB22]